MAHLKDADPKIRAEAAETLAWIAPDTIRTVLPQAIEALDKAPRPDISRRRTNCG